MKEIRFELDPHEPAIFALEPAPPPAPLVTLPERARRGETVRIGLSLEGSAPWGTRIFHVEVFDPAGHAVPYYGGNVQAPDGRAEKVLPLAASDAAGTWRIQIRDVLTGRSTALTLAVD